MKQKNLRVNLYFLITRIQIFGRNVFIYLKFRTCERIEKGFQVS